MKVIGIYSGKGGVGKSTVASLVALALSKTHNTVLVDLDINTPSIPVLFGGRQELPNLHILSTGFKRTGLIDYSGAILRRVVRELTDDAKNLNPDVIVIDMPPGLDDTHFELVNILRPSFFVLVIQPNKLSEEDAKRTSQLFTNLSIPIAGVIQNMSGDIFGTYAEGEVLGLKLLGTIPLNKQIATLGGNGQIDKVKNPLSKVVDYLYTLAGEADWKIVTKAMFEGLEYDELVSTEGYPEVADQDEDEEDYDAYARLDKRRIKKLIKKNELGDFGFRGLKSWGKIRHILMGLNAAGNYDFGRQDKCDLTLDLNDEETIRRMIYSLDDTNSGLFMVARPPNTHIRIFPGEVGVAHLHLEGRYYYNLPRVAYQTDQGEVILFPHEVIPITVNSLDRYIEDGTLHLAKNSKTPRYIPTKANLIAIMATFGRLIGGRTEIEPDYTALCGDNVPERVHGEVIFNET